MFDGRRTCNHAKSRSDAFIPRHLLKWKDLSSRYKFYRGQDLMETIFGKPFDEGYWEANNVASIALARADRLRASGLGIYLDAGDEDASYLHEAAEFLHRLLWDQKIPHEYQLHVAEIKEEV